MKKMSKHSGSRKRYASYADRTRRLLGATDLVAWHDDVSNPVIRFAASVPTSKHKSLADFMTSTPNRWHITARAVVRMPNGETFNEEVEAVTGQALVLHELKEHREQLMKEATANINPKYVEDRVYIMRLARKGDMQ